jgi:hypothetical protein
MGGHADRVNKTRVRVAWNTADYRAEDPSKGTPAGTSINGGKVSGERDLDGNGRSALEGDTNDWYLLSDDIPASTSTDPQTVNTGEITLQRYRFTVNVSGRVLNNSDSTGINGARVVLTVPSSGGTEFDAYSQTRDTQNSTEEGYFNLGTVEWFVEGIDNEADQKSGTVSVVTQVYLDGSTTEASSVTGAIDTLKPDTAVYLNLKVTP